MLKLILLGAFFAAIAYFAYSKYTGNGSKDSDFSLPFSSSKPAQTVKETFNHFVHQTVTKEQVTGTWALTPQSKALLTSVDAPIGLRGTITLEAWGGGQIDIPVGDRKIVTPVSWELFSGSATKAASLQLKGQKISSLFHFTNIGSSIALIAEASEISPDHTGEIRFVKSRS